MYTFVKVFCKTNVFNSFHIFKLNSLKVISYRRSARCSWRPGCSPPARTATGDHVCVVSRPILATRLLAARAYGDHVCVVRQASVEPGPGDQVCAPGDQVCAGRPLHAILSHAILSAPASRTGEAARGPYAPWASRSGVLAIRPTARAGREVSA
jgi:hypothetical protein